MKDWEKVEQIKRLVADCFDNWDRWRWGGGKERDHALTILDWTYRAIRNKSLKERAYLEITKHSRLHAAFLKKLGVYIDF